MLEYNLDLCSGSYSHILTPDASARAFPFYATEYGHFVSGNRYYTRRDSRNDVLLMYTVEGCGEVEWKGQKCLLEPGSAVVIYCDTYHAYRTHSKEPWVFNWIHFEGAGVEGFRPLLLDHLSPVFFEDLSPVPEYFHAIEKMSSSAGVLSWAEISHSISGMLLTLLRGLNRSEETDRKYGRSEIRALVNYIQENHTKQLTTEDFMQIANLSKYHLIHMFRQQMGIPPYKYMHHCRINHAQQLLRTTDESISLIGEMVGYPDPVNFIRQFRQITGTTPAKYRRESMQLP